MSGKLHEIIAVEKDLKTVAMNVLDEAGKTFGTRQGHFDEEKRTYSPLIEDDADIPEDTLNPMVETVQSKLEYVEGKVIRFLDAAFQKESTNTVAKGSIIIVDKNDVETEVAKDVPVTVLVQLEGYLNVIRGMYSKIPTLDPSKRWSPCEDRKGVYETEPLKTVRTKKMPKVLSTAKATKEHKEQVHVYHDDIPVGNFTKVHASSRMTPENKSELLERVDNILAAVRKARARANEEKAVTEKIGRKIFKYING